MRTRWPSWPSARESSPSLRFADPEDALGYLLAFPIWIVAKDLGLVAGAVAAACALAVRRRVIAAQDVALGPLGYLGCAAVFVGAVAAGARAGQPDGGRRASARRRCCRCSPRGPRSCARQEALSRRELQVLEMIATGAKNAADRRPFRDLAEHGQVSRQPDPAEAARREPHRGGLPLHRAVRGALCRRTRQTAEDRRRGIGSPRPAQ